jgi:hypothetical protein
VRCPLLVKFLRHHSWSSAGHLNSGYAAERVTYAIRFVKWEHYLQQPLGITRFLCCLSNLLFYSPRLAAAAADHVPFFRQCRIMPANPSVQRLYHLDVVFNCSCLFVADEGHYCATFYPSLPPPPHESNENNAVVGCIAGEAAGCLWS